MTNPNVKHKTASATADELDALKLIFALKPWQSRGVGRIVGKFLDGDLKALDGVPVLRERVKKAARVIRGEFGGTT